MVQIATAYRSRSRHSQRLNKTRVAAVLACAVASSVVAGRADEIRVFAGGAPQQALRALAPGFEQASGHRIGFTFALVTAIEQKLANGEKPDLIVLPAALIAAMEKSIRLRPEGRGVLARVGVAVITREGAPRPDISTSEAIRKALLAARSIAVPEPSTPSGAHLVRMIEQLGMADAIMPKLIIRAEIDGGADLVASGKADIGFYLLSEVQPAKGITVVGLLPAALQSFVVYGTAIPADNASPGPAMSFVRYISEASRKKNWTGAGFELMGAGD